MRSGPPIQKKLRVKDRVGNQFFSYLRIKVRLGRNLDIELGHELGDTHKSAVELAFAEPPARDVVLKESAPELLSVDSTAVKGAESANGKVDAPGAKAEAHAEKVEEPVENVEAQVAPVNSLPVADVVAESFGPKVEAVASSEQKAERDRSVIPTYGQNPNLSKETIRHLLEVAGDHSKPEAEWLRACHLLGDYTHRPRSKSGPLVPVILAFLLTMGAGAGFYMFYANHDDPLPPVTAPIAAEPDYSDYMTTLQDKIKREWDPPEGKWLLRETKIIFNVNRNGSLVDDPRISVASGTTAYDAAALRAVQLAAPFDPLPAGAPESVAIEFTMKYDHSQTGGAQSPHAHSSPTAASAPDISLPTPSSAVP